MKINTIRKLYHGTDQQFETFDFKYAKSFKDFGKGFYLTSNLQQAQKWAQKKGWKKGTAYIYSYEVKGIADTELKVLELLQYNKQWLDFISRCRMEGFEADYDIIYDRMADSQYSDIADILQEYVAEERSADEAVNKIKWKQTEADQYCFKSKKGLSYLHNLHVIVQYKDDSGRWRQEYER